MGSLTLVLLAKLAERTVWALLRLSCRRGGRVEIRCLRLAEVRRSCVDVLRLIRGGGGSVLCLALCRIEMCGQAVLGVLVVVLGVELILRLALRQLVA